MLHNLKFNYLKVFEVERGLEVGQKFINRNGFFSSVLPMDQFKEKLG